jgi:tetratricopeptide (TPR) repeat protein
MEKSVPIMSNTNLCLRLSSEVEIVEPFDYTQDSIIKAKWYKLRKRFMFKDDGKSGEYHFIEGNKALKNKDPQKAYYHYTKALSTIKNDSQIFNNLGIAYQMMNLPDLAFKNFKVAVQMDLQKGVFNLEAKHNIAVLLWKRGNSQCVKEIDEVIEVCKMINRLNNNYLYTYAMIHYKWDKENAMPIIEEYLKNALDDSEEEDRYEDVLKLYKRLKWLNQDAKNKKS